MFAFSTFAHCLLARTVLNMRGMLCVVTPSVTHLQRPQLKRICSTAPLCVNIFPVYTFTMWSCFSSFLLVFPLILSGSFSHTESSSKTMTAFTFHLLQSDRLTWWINGLYMSLLCVLRFSTLGSKIIAWSDVRRIIPVNRKICSKVVRNSLEILDICFY